MPGSAFLHVDGTATYRDETGARLEAFEKQGWKGVTPFLDAHEGAVVFIDTGKNVVEPVEEQLIEQIKEPVDT